MAARFRSCAAIFSPSRGLLRSSNIGGHAFGLDAWVGLPRSASRRAYRAALCTELKKPLVVEEVSARKLKSNEVRVGVRCVGVNFADTLACQGKYQDRYELPFTPGMELSGCVLETGTSVTTVKEGDRVVGVSGVGAMGEECIVEQQMLWPIPDGISYVQAAALPVSYGTAILALVHRARTQPGETVLVTAAAGATGHAAVDVAANILNAKVIAAAGSKEKCELARRMGATSTLNYTQCSLKEEVRRLTDGQGVDVVIDAVGGDIFKEAFSRNLLKLTGQMERRGDSHANATWIHEIKELLQKPGGCDQARAPVVEVLAHCEIAMDVRSQKIRLRRSLPLLTPWLAPIIWEGTFDTRLLNTLFRLDLRIGLTVFAVKKYSMFLPKFLQSAEKHFMIGRSVRYYIFTDEPNKVPAIPLHTGRSLYIMQIPGNHPWQEISMRRMEILSTMSKRSFYNEVDYLVCVDVDMVFHDHVGVEILGELVATLHPGYFKQPRVSFPYEQRPKSRAYVRPDEGDFYYMGAFFAGTVVQIYQLTDTCHHAILADKSRGIEAVWHDESHLNKYLIRHKPTKVLSPEYMWDMKMPHGDLVKKKRFLAVPKNHAWIRS